eukprot:TRINITY_DN41121_c0_g1_i1.p1 TRINITY_DN41121_c0_g1~~TRINITY_DN41121_c0_g1_i1.p1  ORF type:complete len:515 (-),score=108.49 TRINITY_DN41121_c0_g1_i1:292-1836(-)
MIASSTGCRKAVSPIRQCSSAAMSGCKDDKAQSEHVASAPMTPRMEKERRRMLEAEVISQDGAADAAAGNPHPEVPPDPRPPRVSKVPKILADGTPTPGSGESWEYPLTREEKKHRVMCIFEAELTDATLRLQRVEGSCDDEESHLDDSSPGSTEKATGQQSETAVEEQSEEKASGLQAAAPPSAAVLRKRKAKPSRWSFWYCSTFQIVAGLLQIGFVLGFLWYFDPFSSPTRATSTAETSASASAAPMSVVVPSGPRPALGDVNQTIKDHGEGTNSRSPQPDGRLPMDESTAAPGTLQPDGRLPVVASAAQEHWTIGLNALAASECEKAEAFFAQALDTVEMQFESIQDEDEFNLLADVRNEMIADEGFALVCSQKLEQGVKVLEEYLDARKAADMDTPPHLVNALGYGLFRLGRYVRASHAFRAATVVAKDNLLIWSNLAAAHMAQGDLEAADTAMYQALELPEDAGNLLDSHHKEVLVTNAELLRMRAEGQVVAEKPQVELYYNPHWRWGA